MSVSDALVVKCTESVALAEDLKIRLRISEDEHLRAERELTSQVVESLAICMKSLQLEVVNLDRRIKNLSGQLTR